MRNVAAVAVIALASLAGCASTGNTKIVPLLSAAGIPNTPNFNVPLEVVTRSTAVRDPLPVRNGNGIEYSDIEAALGHAISSATVPWADEHRKLPMAKEGGWQLFVEVTDMDAQFDDGRVIFSVNVRATLRQRAGNLYLAQTQASCRQGGVTAPEQGAPIMYRCMMQVGRELGGWLDGVDLSAVRTAEETTPAPSPTQQQPSPDTSTASSSAKR